MTDAEIAALKAAAERATKGEWVAGHERDHAPEVSVHIPCSDGGSWWIATVYDAAKGVSAANNAAYIALANPDAILALIARLEATERSRDWYRCACAEADDRAQAAEARTKQLAAELSDAINVIEDYLNYEHSGDPWEEDRRAMREMDIDDYGRDGRLARAKAALAAERGEAAQRTERSPAERFAAAILLPCLRGDRSVVEGWAIEEAALAAGLIKEVQAQEPCGARCACSDLGVGFPTTCNRLTEAGKALRGEAEGGEP